MKDEALRMALEALERNDYLGYQANQKAIAAIKEALEQPEGCQCPACNVTPHTSDCAVHNEPAYPNGECDCGAQPEQDYLAGVPPMLPQMRDGETIVVTEYAQPEQDPVAWMTPTGALYRTEDVDGCFDEKHIPLYTTPPHRKPLTDEEIEFIYADTGYNDIQMFARAIEAAHGIKE